MRPASRSEGRSRYERLRVRCLPHGPAQILEAWRGGRVRPVISAPILEEYRRVGLVLAARYEGVDLEPILTLLAVHGEVVEAPEITEAVS